MKKLILLVAGITLLSSSYRASAQLDFKYQNTLVQEYVPIEQADEELPVQKTGQIIALGFEIKSYGLICNSIYLYEDYVTLFFNNWNYHIAIYPTATGIEPEYSIGTKWLIKRTTEQGKRTILLELRDLEYQGYPGEKLNIQFKLNEWGECSVHYGGNNLSSQHRLNNGNNVVFFLEDDYEKNLADTTGQDYYRSVVAIYGDPLEPNIDVNTVEHELGSFTHHPPANTLYLVKSSTLSGVAEVNKGRSVLRITPNPANGSCSVELSGTAVTRLHMTDVSGRRVLEKPVPANEHKLNLDLSSLPAGTYFLQGINQGKTVVVEKLLVK